MKIVCAADTYITPEMMEGGVRPYLAPEDSLQTFFFGVWGKEGMRDINRAIETGHRREVALPEGFLEAAREADLLIVHLCPVNEDLLEGARNLKAVMSCRGGLENVAVEKASELGIIVSNNPAHNANAVAEYTIGMILCETRNIGRAHSALKNGEWRKSFPNSETTIRELCDMTVGIVGFGSIGRLVAAKLLPFGCRILASDPFATSSGVDYVSLVPFEELLAQSDVVTLHARSDKAIMTEHEFSLMKQNSYLINTARAYLVESDAFRAAMDSGKLLGAAIDVFESEPDIPEFYRSYDNITLTTHRGGDTINSYKDAPAFAISNYLGYAQEGKDLRFFANRNSIRK